MTCKSVTEDVRRNPFGDASTRCGLIDGALDMRFVQVIAPLLPELGNEREGGWPPGRQTGRYRGAWPQARSGAACMQVAAIPWLRWATDWFLEASLARKGPRLAGAPVEWPYLWQKSK